MPSPSSVATPPSAMPSTNGTHDVGTAAANGCLPADQSCFALLAAASSPPAGSYASTRRDATRACCTTASYIVVLGISFGSLLAILLILCIIRWYLVWRSTQRRGDVGNGAAAADEAPGSAKKPSAGLDADAIAALPEFAFRRDVGGSRREEDEEEECAVCLAVMTDGEAARRLPRCTHLFHRGCVDVWLADHSTCPVCRAEVIVVTQAGGVCAENVSGSTSRALTSPALPPVGTSDNNGREIRDLEAQQ